MLGKVLFALLVVAACAVLFWYPIFLIFKSESSENVEENNEELSTEDREPYRQSDYKKPEINMLLKSEGTNRIQYEVLYSNKGGRGGRTINPSEDPEMRDFLKRWNHWGKTRLFIDEFVFNVAFYVRKASEGVIVLQCSGTFPVEWNYLGYGNVITTNDNERTFSDFNNWTTYRFSSTLTFYSLSEHNTGLYICQPAMSKRFLKIPPSSSVYLYFSGYKTFAGPPDGVNLFEEADTRSRVQPIICPLAKPTRTVGLMYSPPIQNNDTSPSVYSVRHNQILNFNALRGFDVVDPLPGRYFCQDVEANSMISASYTILDTRESIVRGPALRLNDPASKSKWSIRCEAKKPVYFTFSNTFNEFLPKKYLTNEYITKNSSSEYPYVAYLRLRTGQYIPSHRKSAIFCATGVGREQHRILRVWEFIPGYESPDRLRETNLSAELTFSKVLQCCSSGGQALLSYQGCATPSECHIRRTSCFTNPVAWGSCVFVPRDHATTSSCVSLEPPTSSGLGVCGASDETDRITHNSDSSFNYFQMIRKSNHKVYSYFEGYGLYKAITSSKFGDEEISASATVRVELEYRTRRPKGTVRCHCFGVKFYIANGIQWTISGTLEKSNNSVIPSTSRALNKEVDTHEVHEWLELPYKDLKGRWVTCLAPVLHSPTAWLEMTTFVE